MYNRRRFLEISALGAGLSLLPASVSANKTVTQRSFKSSQLTEPSRDIPISGNYDVIVCGGGPAGIAAALSSARSGSKTLLVELGGCLGGVWTSGLLTFIFDFNKPGITEEIKQRLDAIGARRNKTENNFVYSPEPMKLIVEQMCLDSGVDILLHTRVVAAYLKNKRLTTIVTESKSGREAWTANAFIDTTGDGDLGALAGNGWEMGLGDETCPCQPLTLNALAVVKDVEKLKDFLSFYDFNKADFKDHVQKYHVFKDEILRAGIDPSYGSPTLFPIKDNLVMIMANHEYNVKATDAREVTKATLNARAEVHKISQALAKLGGPWEGFQLIATADQIGIRDGRRLFGRYRMTKEDLANGRSFDDGVTRVNFGVDIHALDREKNKTRPIDGSQIPMKPYQIPIRALIARDVDGLMMAGRCISGDFISHASYRVTGDAVAMGEAAGTVASIAARSNRMPHEVEWNEAKSLLKF